jgi:cysteine desulfurase/selenocysteine lyase
MQHAVSTSTLIPEYRDLFVGLDCDVPLLDGSLRPYINLDNAASTPCLQAVERAVHNFLVYYSSVHRGTGFKSQLATHAYEQAREIVMNFVGADPAEHVCIFGKNTTEAINKLARRFPFPPGRDTVLVSMMEHHSNDLPWRPVANVVHVKVTRDGRLDEADFDAQLARYADRMALVAISGASNVTGYINPVHRLAEKAHAVGAQIAVDCAQLAPHRAIHMGGLDDPAHFDYIALSAHKMYAPLGTGALVGRRDTFAQGDPDLQGGGTVEIVTADSVTWAGPPDRDEAGSPNTVGAVALATAIRQLEAIGMDAVAQHEAELTRYALHELARVPGIQIWGDPSPERTGNRLGVIPFNLDGISHFLVAAILGYEFGIGVRNGCFCAHPYILHLLGLSAEEANEVRTHMLNKDRSEMPGLVRASFGLYNTFAEVAALVEALAHIARGEYRGVYDQDQATGEFHPRDWQPDFAPYFAF